MRSMRALFPSEAARQELGEREYERSDDNQSVDEDNHGLTEKGRFLIQLFSEMQAARKPKTRPNLFSIVTSRQGFSVTDTRDLIYGHLAVARLPSKKNVPLCPIVDYQRSVREVFTDGASYMLSENGANEVLLQVEVRDPSRRLKGLPSWVPDWSLDPSELVTPFPPFRTIGVREFYPLNAVAEFPSSTICSIRCVKVDYIKATSAIVPPMTHELEMPSEFRELRAAVYQKNRSEKPYLKSTPKYQDAYRLFPQLIGKVVVSPLPEEDVEFCDRDEGWRIFDDAFQKDSSAFHPFEYDNYYAIGVEGLLMRHALKLDDRSFPVNRRVAVLSEGGLGFVPAGSRPGDEVYAFLMGLRLHMLVLRPYPNASAADMTDIEFKPENLDNRGWSNIRPFTLVGCAFIMWSWTAAFKEAPGNFEGFRNAGEPTDKFRDRKTTALLY